MYTASKVRSGFILMELNQDTKHMEELQRTEETQYYVIHVVILFITNATHLIMTNAG